MKPYKYIPFILLLVLFVNGGCEEKKYQEGKRFIIQNNSDKEIIVKGQGTIEYDFTNLCRENLTRFEYYDIIRDCMVTPYSNKNIERQRIAEYLMEHPNDTMRIIVFYRMDMDKEPCTKSPVKKTWKVTLKDIEACDWTLVYEPDSIE